MRTHTQQHADAYVAACGHIRKSTRTHMTFVASKRTHMQQHAMTGAKKKKKRGHTCLKTVTHFECLHLN